MAIAINGPKFYAWDRDGSPLAYGKVYTYEAGTTTPKATYTGEDGSVANTNPVILNGEGYASIYLDGSYNIIVKDSEENTIYSQDPVSSNLNQEWVNCVTASYVSTSSVIMSGNHVAEYTEERSARVSNQSTGYAYSRIVSAVYSNGNTTVTLADSVVSADVQGICTSIVSEKSFPDIQYYSRNNFIKYVTPEMSITEIKGMFTEGSTIYFAPGSYVGDVSESAALFEVQSNTKVYMAPGCEISITPSGVDTYQFFKIIDAENIEIWGGKLVGDKDTNTITTGEFGMGVAIWNSQNIKINGIDISKMWGDGIYIGGWESSTLTTDIRVDNCEIYDCRRQGISLVAGERVWIEDNYIHSIAGTAPEACIDIEPNPTAGGAGQFITTEVYVKNNILKNSETGVLMSGPHQLGTRVYITGNTIEGNIRHIDAKSNDDNIGHLEVSNNKFFDSAYAMGAYRYIENLQVESNYHQGNKSGASGAIFGWDVRDVVNAVFSDENIIDNLFQPSTTCYDFGAGIVDLYFHCYIEGSRGVTVDSSDISNYSITGKFNTGSITPIIINSSTPNVGVVSGDFSGFNSSFPVVDENAEIAYNVTVCDYVDIDKKYVSRIGGVLPGDMVHDNIDPAIRYCPTLSKYVTYDAGTIATIGPHGYETSGNMTKGSATGLPPSGTSVKGIRFSGSEYYTLNYGDNPRLFNENSLNIIVFKCDAYSANGTIFDGRYTEGAFYNGVRLVHTAANQVTLIYGSDSDLSLNLTLNDGEVHVIAFFQEDDSGFRVIADSPYTSRLLTNIRPGNDSDNLTKDVTFGALDDGSQLFNGVIYDVLIFEYHINTFNDREYYRIIHSIYNFYKNQDLT